MTQPAQYISGRTVQEQMNELISYVDTRAAEVATDAIASDVAQVHQDMLDADADAQAAAASAAAAAGTLANAVKKTGESSQSIAGDIAVSGNLTVGGTAGFTGAVTVPTPANNTDAATKKYVDDANALDVHLTGAQAITGVKTVPLETTGTVSGQIASSQKVKNELDNYAPMVRNTGNIKVSGTKQFQDAISRGCTSADMLADPTTSVGATVLSLVDLMQGDTHNSIGSMTKVRNTANQNYFDIQSTSYGFTEGGVQQRMDIFLRLLINDSTGDAQLIIYRSKRNADGTGTTDIKSKVLATITAAGVIT